MGGGGKGQTDMHSCSKSGVCFMMLCKVFDINTRSYLELFPFSFLIDL